MSISWLSTKSVVTIDADSSIKEAAKMMKDNNTGDIVVVNNEKSIGILTDRDIVIRLVANDVDINAVKVSDVMTEDLLTLNKNTSLTDAIEEMSEKGVRRAPVVDESDKLCGIVSVDDILVLLTKKLNKLGSLIQKQIYH